MRPNIIHLQLQSCDMKVNISYNLTLYYNFGKTFLFKPDTTLFGNLVRIRPKHPDPIESRFAILGTTTPKFFLNTVKQNKYIKKDTQITFCN